MKVRLDAQVATSFGRRATDWEIKGVPVRIEVGPRDLAEGLVTLVRRDTGEKRTAPIGEVEHRVTNLLSMIQADLLAAATQRRDDRTVEVASVEEAVEAATVGFARIAVGPDQGWRRGAPRAGGDLGPLPADRRTAGSPPARTTPTSLPTSPGATDGIGAFERAPGRIPPLFRSFGVLGRRGLRPAPLLCQEEVRDCR